MGTASQVPEEMFSWKWYGYLGLILRHKPVKDIRWKINIIFKNLKHNVGQFLEINELIHWHL